jgi:hypothetical protein
MYFKVAASLLAMAIYPAAQLRLNADTGLSNKSSR